MATPISVDLIELLDEDSCASSLTDLSLESSQYDTDLPADAASFNKAASRRIDMLFRISSFIPEHDGEMESMRNIGLEINESWASELVAEEFRVVTRDNNRLFARLCGAIAQRRHRIDIRRDMGVSHDKSAGEQRRHMSSYPLEFNRSKSLLSVRTDIPSLPVVDPEVSRFPHIPFAIGDTKTYLCPYCLEVQSDLAEHKWQYVHSLQVRLL